MLDRHHVGGELGVIDSKDVLGWASHGADLPFVFGNDRGPDLYSNTAIDVPFTPREKQLSTSIRSY